MRLLYLFGISIVGLGILLLSGSCSSHIPTTTPAIGISPTETSQPVIVIKETPTNISSSANCEPNKTLVLAENAKIDGWSADGRTLYFSTGSEGDYPQHKSFDVASGMITILQSTTPTPDPLKAYLLNLIQNDRITEHSYSISPAGDKAIYFEKLYFGAESTPAPSGEYYRPNINIIYLVTQDLTEITLGEMTGSISGFTWLSDEEHVVIDTEVPPVIQYPSWLVDIADRRIEPYLKQGAYFRDISPDERWILYQYDHQLWVLDTTNGSEYQLSLDGYMHNMFWWLGNDEFLVIKLYIPSSYSEIHKSDSVVVYNLRTNEKHEFITKGFRVFFDAKVPAAFSPSTMKLAFREYGTGFINILTLCEDKIR